MRHLYNFLFTVIPTFLHCFFCGLTFDKTWKIRGRLYINRNSWILRHRHPEIQKGSITIGKYFCCNNKLESNSVGIFQPCFFNISNSGSRIILGNNVGISGTTINATTTITIGDNTIIGSGCLITDTDSHPIFLAHRLLPTGGGMLNASQLRLGKVYS